jgi:alpha-galactosidase
MKQISGFRIDRYTRISRHGALLAVCCLGFISSLPALNAPALTPPMGWNSYDCWSYGATDSIVKINADYMAEHLKQYGWEYVVIDYIWWLPLVGPGGNIPQDANYNPRGNMDGYGRWLPDTLRFPSAKGGVGFKGLADYVHSKGLKFGIHVMRGIPRQAVGFDSPIEGTNYTCSQVADKVNVCSWLNAMWGLDMSKPGAQEYLNSILRLYASWEVDFIKLDDLTWWKADKFYNIVGCGTDNSGNIYIGMWEGAVCIRCLNPDLTLKW